MGKESTTEPLEVYFRLAYFEQCMLVLDKKLSELLVFCVLLSKFLFGIFCVLETDTHIHIYSIHPSLRKIVWSTLYYNMQFFPNNFPVQTGGKKIGWQQMVDSKFAYKKFTLFSSQFGFKKWNQRQASNRVMYR
jgi:hypothetical protein